MKQPLLVSVLGQPELVKRLTNQQWNLLLQQARASGLQLALLLSLKKNTLYDLLPEKIATALDNEVYRVEYQRVQVWNEVNKLNKILAVRDIQPIYLKGTAYQLLGLPLAQYRVFSDIDILLDKEMIDDAEISLKCEGFISEKTNDYDQKYYREYMHEIPPLIHISRGTVLDIHHNILPVCREHPLNIALLKERVTTLVDDANNKFHVFDPAAMFIHSSVHLFNESEFDKGLRDLTDLASMYVHFSNEDPEFSAKVIELAEKTELTKAIYYSFSYISKVLNVELTDSDYQFLLATRKSMKFPKVYDFIFTRVLIPFHQSCENWEVKLAKFLAYWRGHLLRMPLKLLIPHLAKKTTMQLKDMLSKDSDTTKTEPKL